MIRHGVPFRPQSSRLRCGLFAFAAVSLLGGCGTVRAGGAERPAPQVIVETPPPEPAWRGIIHSDDQARLNGAQARWAQALDQARRGGFARRVTAEGALLDPDAALPRPAPAPGSYRCRLIRIAHGTRRQRALTVRGPYFCYVGADDDMLSLTQQTGGTRPGGYLYDDNDGARMIFIGAAATGREQVPPAYGDDAERNVVGIMERVAPFRYRLVIPAPASGATLEVLELVPALP